ncbi:MAG: hypothetical protein AVDCRST_MAG68-3913, partial [uncultured Gemmatimonadetes bacterium]
GIPRIHRFGGHRVAGLGHVPQLRLQRALHLRGRVAGLRVSVGAPPPPPGPGGLGQRARRRPVGVARRRHACRRAPDGELPQPDAPRARRSRRDRRDRPEQRAPGRHPRGGGTSPLGHPHRHQHDRPARQGL